jgi:hypothetical protein
MTTMEQITPTPPRTDPVPEDLAAARTKLLDLEEQARALVRERPVVAMLAALGLGYFVARLFTRRSR